MDAILKDKTNQIRINDMFQVPKLHVYLLPMSKLVSNGLKVQFNLNEYIIKSCNGIVFAIMPRELIL